MAEYWERMQRAGHSLTAKKGRGAKYRATRNRN